MGAYLTYKTDSAKSAEKIMKHIAKRCDDPTSSFARLKAVVRLMRFRTIDAAREMIDWERKIASGVSEEDLLSLVGVGEIKVSGFYAGEFESIGIKKYCEDDIYEVMTQAFDELNTHWNISYYAASCTLDIEEYYFSIDQMRTLTRNGSLLSGRETEEYQALYPALSSQLFVA